MTNMLLIAMFATFGLTAIARIVLTVVRYGRQAAAVRGELLNCDDVRQVQVRVSELRVRMTGVVLTPNFTPGVRLPAAKRGLRAAA